MTYQFSRNTLYTLVLITLSPLTSAEQWDGTALGFEAPPKLILGDTQYS